MDDDENGYRADSSVTSVSGMSEYPKVSVFVIMTDNIVCVLLSYAHHYIYMYIYSEFREIPEFQWNSMNSEFPGTPVLFTATYHLLDLRHDSLIISLTYAAI